MTTTDSTSARTTAARAAALAVALLGCAAVALASLGGCRADTQDVRGGAVGDRTLPQRQAGPAKAADTTGLPNEGILANVAIGDIAGVGNNTLDATIRNPYVGDMAAIKEGHDLFVGMNCAGCHGYDLKGGMGPDLTDTYWRYGGSPADIYKSVFEGRPQGMPAWGRSIPPALVWKVVAYIQSKGGAYPAALADRGRQGDLGDEDTTSFGTLKGRNNP
ncbi:MAG TPA: c-type cytochrome [Gemmatimonadaceae bacterium]|nr:c-type cytochrome [Gemmatimonadaceae bacterium]